MKYKARDIYKELGYIRWENFNSIMLKSIQLINNGLHKGEINEIISLVLIGKTAKRAIIDYEFDDDSLLLIKRISSKVKILGVPRERNEVQILLLLKKYCQYKDIKFEPQKRVNNFYFDALINNTLIEFDEIHHLKTGQLKIDNKKDKTALKNGYNILRITIYSDIIDIIQKLNI